MKAGQTVKFKNPLNDNEEEEQFIILELRGDHVLVEYVCTMNIKPTFVYLMSDLIEAN